MWVSHKGTLEWLYNTCTYTHIHVHAHMHAHVHACMDASVHRHVHATCALSHMPTPSHTHVRSHIHSHTHVRTHTHLGMYLCACMHACMWFPRVRGHPGVCACVCWLGGMIGKQVLHNVEINRMFQMFLFCKQLYNLLYILIYIFLQTTIFVFVHFCK